MFYNLLVRYLINPGIYQQGIAMALDCLLGSMSLLDIIASHPRHLYRLGSSILLDTFLWRTQYLAMDNSSPENMEDIRSLLPILPTKSWYLLDIRLVQYCLLDNSGLADKCRSS